MTNDVRSNYQVMRLLLLYLEVTAQEVCWYTYVNAILISIAYYLLKYFQIFQQNITDRSLIYEMKAKFPPIL